MAYSPMPKAFRVGTKTASVQCEAPPPGSKNQVSVDGIAWLAFGSMVQTAVPVQPLPVQPPAAAVQPGPLAARLRFTPSLGLFGQPTPAISGPATARGLERGAGVRVAPGPGDAGVGADTRA